MCPSEELLKGIPKAIVTGKTAFTEEQAQYEKDFDKILKEMGILKENESIKDLNPIFKEPAE